MFNRRKKNLLLILVLVAVVIGVGTAFTAANTFDAKAGQELGYGTQTVSGASVTSMHYTLIGGRHDGGHRHVHRHRRPDAGRAAGSRLCRLHLRCGHGRSERDV